MFLQSDRLILRTWRESDREPFAALNADARVMEHFPAALSREESDAMIVRICSHFDHYGFGFWAVEAKGVARFIGFVGIAVPTFKPPFTIRAPARIDAPCVEIGWRLALPFWGNGYATEAARRVLAHAFDSLEIPEVVSFTVQTNVRSIHVMRAIGMQRDAADDFDHPNLPERHPLRRHVLYRIRP